MAEIINGPVNLGEISEPARKRITRTQQHGAAAVCVPVDVEIRGGAYIPVEGGDSRPWDTVGEFRFSLYISKGRKGVAEEVIRYNLTGDGRMRRLIAGETGYLADGETNDREPLVLHDNNDPLSTLRPKVSWREDVKVRGVDAKVTQDTNPQTGQEEAILHFIAVPEPGQWGGVAGFGDKFPGADRQRAIINSLDNPIPFLQPVGVIF